ncbi:Het and ankyrin domain protein [Colletotrichum higginsianum IMI 349063]|uniref:Het and ankyrin domain protein n=1 Tax=Colletotrichum higginsianum (strain IMI 349063) TaxID=759273 RepID=A0A1B7YT75_COLHI|nr:Het and ankyrin domain protein [Colletotrichum higginsianum IMI 349063]OBR15154.1 Het and ankyrin domain protein [Colletotrichum higginsianum IMI 349063]
MSTEPPRWKRELTATPREDNRRSLSLPSNVANSTSHVALVDPRLCFSISNLANAPKWPPDPYTSTSGRPDGITSSGTSSISPWNSFAYFYPSLSSGNEFSLIGTQFNGKPQQCRESNLVESKAPLRVTAMLSALDTSSSPGWKQSPDSIQESEVLHWNPLDQYEYPLSEFGSRIATPSSNISPEINHCSTASSPGLEGNFINAADGVEHRRRLQISSSSKRTMDTPVLIDEGSIKRPRCSVQLPDSAMRSDESSDDENAAVKRDKLLACPFFRYNAGRHTSCLNLKMRRIRDVKQHLKRRHSEPQYYCTTCYRIFTTESKRSQHVRDKSLVPCFPTDGRPDFVTAHERQLLCAKASRNATLEDQWYSVWDKIFIGKPRPPHPFMRTVVEEVTSMMREFWQNEGEQIVRKFTGPLQMQDGDEARLKNVMLNMMEESHNVFGTRFRSSTPVEGSVAAPDNEQLPNPHHHSSGLPHGEDNNDEVVSATSLEQMDLNGLLHQPCSRPVSDFNENQVWEGIPAGFDATVDIGPNLNDAGCTDLYKGAENAIIDAMEKYGWSSIDYSNQGLFQCPYLIENGIQEVQMDSLPI